VGQTYNFDGHKLLHHMDRLHEYLAAGDCYPLYMELSPVGSCNHRCLFCAYDYIGHPGRRLETRRTLEFISELGAQGLRSIVFAGEGEPLIHPDICEMVTHASAAGIDCGMFSNGQLLDQRRAEVLLPAMKFLRFSFNAGRAAEYAKVHQVNEAVFDKVVKNIEQAARIKREQGLAVTLGAQLVLLPENVETLSAAALLLREIGLQYLVIKPFVQQNEQQFYKIGPDFNWEFLKSKLADVEALGTSEFAVIPRHVAFDDYGKRSYEHCYGCSFITVLNSAGDLASCLPYWDRPEFVYGNIYKSSLREIWEGEQRKRVKQHLEQKLCAADCPANCRPNAINAFLSEIKHPTVEHVNFI
jgi:cyclic pyranopterin phosphate synthase